MLKYMSGSIFNSQADALVNPVNMVGVMGAGLAKQFKLRYPEMYADYKLFTDTGYWDRYGTTVFYNNMAFDIQLHYYRHGRNTRGKYIINLPTKVHWKDNSSVSMMIQSLTDLSLFVRSKGLEHIAIPHLGCGLGGLNWNSDVRPLVEEILDEESLLIEIWDGKSIAQ